MIIGGDFILNKYTRDRKKVMAFAKGLKKEDDESVTSSLRFNKKHPG